MSLTREQMALRRTLIGSSEIGALIGINPHRTALDVFEEKVYGKIPETPEEEEDHRSWGLDVEGATLANHLRRADLELLPSPGTVTARTIPAFCCTPDALAVSPRDRKARNIQAKNVLAIHAHGWGEPGTDNAPLLYVAQVTVELGVLRAQDEDFWRALAKREPRAHPFDGFDDTADLVATIGGAPPVAYRVRFDADLFGTLNDLALKFLRDHVLPGREPYGWEKDRHALDYVKRRFPQHDDRLLPASIDAQAIVEKLHGLSGLDKEAKALKAQLAKIIGDAQGIEGLATFKRCKDTTKTLVDWEGAARELAGAITTPDAVESLMARLAADHQRQIVTKKGSRRFRLLGATDSNEED